MMKLNYLHVISCYFHIFRFGLNVQNISQRIFILQKLGRTGMVLACGAFDEKLSEINKCNKGAKGWKIQEVKESRLQAEPKGRVGRQSVHCFTSSFTVMCFQQCLLLLLLC